MVEWYSFLIGSRVRSECQTMVRNAALDFLMVGVFGVLAIALIEWRFWRRWLGWVLVTSGCLLAVCVLSLKGFDVTLGRVDWYNRFPFRDVIFFLLMCLGMIAQALSSALSERRARTAERRKTDPEAPPAPLRIDRWELTLPALVAVPVFFALLAQLERQDVTTTALAIAFQNGFMWKAILHQPTR
jgi:cell division protein FtsW (lipid II flippase)